MGIAGWAELRGEEELQPRALRRRLAAASIEGSIDSFMAEPFLSPAL